MSLDGRRKEDEDKERRGVSVCLCMRNKDHSSYEARKILESLVSKLLGSANDNPGMPKYRTFNY